MLINSDIAHVLARMKRTQQTSPYSVSYQPTGAGEYWRTLAKEGYGQPGMRDLLAPQIQGIQNQYMNQRDRFIGSAGQRGLYDSSIKERGLAGLVGAREAAIGTAETNVWEKNQRVMLEGQRMLDKIRQFNLSNQLKTDMFNQQSAQTWQQHREQMALQEQQLREMQRQSGSNFWSGLGSIGAGLLSTGNPFAMAGGGALSLASLIGSL